MNRTLVFVTSLAVLSICPLIVHAGLITVTTTDGGGVNIDGECNLAEATMAANFNTTVDTCAAGSGVGTDSIYISVTGTIDMAQDLGISERVQIFGPVTDSITLSGQETTRHFIVSMPDDSHDFELSLVTLANGSAPLSETGGSIRIDRVGTARFSNVRFIDNYAPDEGGAIAAAVPVGDDARLELVQCRFEGNLAAAGSAAALLGMPDFADFDSVIVERCTFTGNQTFDDYGTLFIEGADLLSVSQSSFTDNLADFRGGAIVWLANSSNDLMVIDDSTFDSNSASGGGQGGAIAQFGGVSAITNSTFNDNYADTGSSLFASQSASAVLHFSTLYQEIPPALFIEDSSTLDVGHSIIWTRQGSPPLEPDCVSGTGGSITSAGFNIDSSGSCTSQATDMPETDPLVFPLADHGDMAGMVTLKTLLPKPGSPAVDGGAAADCPGLFGSSVVLDQRGEPRPVSGVRGGAECDIGAVEVQASDPTGFPLMVTLTGNGTGVVRGSPGSLDCSGLCEDRFLAGETARLFVQPAIRTEFVGWGGDCSGTMEPCELLMDGPKNVSAEFVPLYGLYVDLQGNATGSVTSLTPGLIDCPHVCGGLFREDDSLTLMATVGSGARFQNWNGACVGTGDCSVSMSGDLDVGAVFVTDDTLFFDSFE